MATGTYATLFDELVKKHIEPLRSKYDPVIVFPDLHAIRYCNPFNTVLYKIAENNPHFHIVTPEELGEDIIWEFQRKSNFKKPKISMFILNSKIVCFDYMDVVSIKNSFGRHCVTVARKDQVAGIIKFQYSKDHYGHFPVPIFPFFYPGFNDYRHVSQGYPLVDIAKYRKKFDECCATNTFASSIFARWAGFPVRMQYTKLCESIPNSDVTTDNIPFPEYVDCMSTSRFAIAMKGNGQFSHREMEVAAIGVPLFYGDRGQRMLEPFLPGIHYIKVTPENFHDKFNYYMEHYDEALTIGRKAREYYDENLLQPGMQNAFKKIVDMLLTRETWIEY